MHLVGCNSSPQHYRSDVRKTGLFLCVNADVVAINVVGRMLFHCGIETEPEPLMQLVEKLLSRPSVTQEEELQASALAMLAQNFGVTEQFGDPLDHRHNLTLLNKCIEARTKIRLRRKTSSNTQGKSNFFLPANRARDRGQANVINFRIGAPGVASGDGNLELSRQVVKFRVSREQLRCFEHQR